MWNVKFWCLPDDGCWSWIPVRWKWLHTKTKSLIQSPATSLGTPVKSYSIQYNSSAIFSTFMISFFHFQFLLTLSGKLSFCFMLTKVVLSDGGVLGAIILTGVPNMLPLSRNGMDKILGTPVNILHPSTPPSPSIRP